MRNWISAPVLLGSLLAGLVGPTPAAAQQPSVGIGDPLSLAAYGALLPYITRGGTFALVEVASPVGSNLSLELTFFDAACARSVSVSLPETQNDIGFVDVNSLVPAGQNGIVAITGGSGPLTSPIHARVYLFNSADGRSRVLEPIILDTAESPGGPNTWSPLRTGATFFAPAQTATINTDLTLICPIATIQDATDTIVQQAFPTARGFPPIFPPFPGATSAGNLQVLVYAGDRTPLGDSLITCACLTEVALTDVSSIYSDPRRGSLGSYTEILVDPSKQNAFTGYRSVSTVGSAMNNFFGRLSGGSQSSLQGALTRDVR